MAKKTREYLGVETHDGDDLHVFEVRKDVDAFTEDIERIGITDSQLQEVGIEFLTGDAYLHKIWPDLYENAAYTVSVTETDETPELEAGEFMIETAGLPSVTEAGQMDTGTLTNRITVTGDDPDEESVYVAFATPASVSIQDVSSAFTRPEPIPSDEVNNSTETYELCLPFESGHTYNPSISFSTNDDYDGSAEITVWYLIDDDIVEEHTVTLRDPYQVESDGATNIG